MVALPCFETLLPILCSKISTASLTYLFLSFSCLPSSKLNMIISCEFPSKEGRPNEASCTARSREDPICTIFDKISVIVIFHAAEDYSDLSSAVLTKESG